MAGSKEFNVFNEPIFEKPLWPLVGDSKTRKYGCMSNVITVKPQNSTHHLKTVQIPTALFSLMRVMYTPNQLTMFGKKGGFLALSQDDKHRWFLTMHVDKTHTLKTSDTLRTLWFYTPAQVPGWLIQKG